MKEHILQVCDVISKTLHHQTYNETIINDDAFYKISRENGLSGMLYQTLLKERTSLALYGKLQKEYYIYHAQDIKHLKVIDDVTTIFNDMKIHHIFMKGSHLKSFYPASYMRIMSDIDVLVTEDDLPAIHAKFMLQGYKKTHDSYAHKVYETTGGIFVEVHPNLVHKTNSKYQGFFSKCWESTTVTSGYSNILEPTFELVYLLEHARKHFYSSGFGIRTLLDIGLFFQHNQSTINIQLLHMYLEETSLTLFALNMLQLSNNLFHLDLRSEFLSESKIDSAFLDKILKYIVISGVHGYGKDFNQTLPRMVMTKRRKKSKIHLILSILFPKLIIMKQQYAFVKKIPILYPIGWFLRIIRFLTKDYKRAKYQLKQLGIPDEQLTLAIQLYDEFGL